MNTITRVHDVFATKMMLDDIHNINNRFQHSEVSASSALSLNDYQSHSSIDDHIIEYGRRDYNIFSGEYEPMLEKSRNSKSRVLPKGIKEPLRPSFSSDNDDFKINQHLPGSSLTVPLSTIKQQNNIEVARGTHLNINEDNESRALDLSESCSVLNDSSQTQVKPITDEYYPQTPTDYYLQEFNAGINQLTRWSSRMKELTSMDPVEFKAALENFRSQTGENPLRTWTVKVNSVIGLMRDIQYDMETETAGHV